eukprot:7021327-Pyramimonas_sp.AAC.2
MSQEEVVKEKVRNETRGRKGRAVGRMRRRCGDTSGICSVLCVLAAWRLLSAAVRSHLGLHVRMSVTGWMAIN